MDEQYKNLMADKFYSAVESSSMRWIDIGRVMGFKNPRAVYRLKHRRSLTFYMGKLTLDRIEKFLKYVEGTK